MAINRLTSYNRCHVDLSSTLQFEHWIISLSNITVQNHFSTKCSVAKLFRFVAHFTRVRIEDYIQRIACFIAWLCSNDRHADPRTPPPSKKITLSKWL